MAAAWAALQSWWSSAGSVVIALVVGLLAAWLVYRLQRREEREGVLSALVAELQLQEDWVGRGGYPAGSWKDRSAQWWGDAADALVYKLSTVATDNAIQVGPSLFVNRDLVRALVHFRQRAHQVNQVIDDMAACRATPELWIQADERTTTQLRTRLDMLAGMIHENAIGDKAGDGANHHYHAVRDALRAERTLSWVRYWGWFLFAISRRAKDEPKPSW
jgi:hypothetical protein